MASKALQARHSIAMGSQRSGDPRNISRFVKPFRGDTFRLLRLFPSVCAAPKRLIGGVAWNEGLRYLPPHKFALLLYRVSVASHPCYDVTPAEGFVGWIPVPAFAGRDPCGNDEEIKQEWQEGETGISRRKSRNYKRRKQENVLTYLHGFIVYNKDGNRAFTQEVIMAQFKVILLSIVCVVAAACLCAQTPYWTDTQNVGGTWNDGVWSMATDSEGSVYVIGYFGSIITFGDITLNAYDEYRMFIAKMNANGDWLWANQLSIGAYWCGNALAIDNEDNCYVMGQFSGSITFGAISLSSSSPMGLFVAKLDSDGNWLMAVQAGGVGSIDQYNIAVDADNNAYVTGTFSNVVTFGTNILSSTGGSINTFVAKLDATGNWLWAKQTLGGNLVVPQGIALDSDANIYLTGYFTAPATFGEHALTCDIMDTFVTKLDSNGNWLWARKSGSTNGQGIAMAYGITIDSMANIYVAGVFQNTVSFGNDSLISISQSEDIFVAKMDTNGNWLWARQAGGQENDCARDIAIQSDDLLYIFGSFIGSATFGNRTLNGFGDQDIFVARIDTNGNWNTVKAAGGVGADSGESIVVSPISGIFASGGFTDIAGFDGNILSSNGDWDIFIANVQIATPVGDELDVPELPFSIVNCYPNPFSKTTKIVVNIEDSKDVYELAVYDLRGRKLKILHNGALPKGERTFTWMADDVLFCNLPSGVYFYKLSNGTTSQTRKMVLVK